MKLRFLKIELGNGLPGSLIAGTQSLFELKCSFNLEGNIYHGFSEQKSETSTIRVDGGAQTTNFEICR